MGNRNQTAAGPAEFRERRATVIAEEYHIPLPHVQSHPRTWRENGYVYPVISRRSRGLSVGVNLNPDKACNFGCIYCQVDREDRPALRRVDPARVADELSTMLDLATSGTLFEDDQFANVPANLRRVADIAFSGDGEPTTCKQFLECVQIAASEKRRRDLADTKIILLTDACYLTRPDVVEALAIMDANQGEVWAKLDAGTEDYFRRVNQPNYPLTHVVANITAAAQVRPVVIQSMFMRIEGALPTELELDAYCARLKEILDAGGMIKYVQVYTVARPPAEAAIVGSLNDEEVDAIADRVRQHTGLTAEPYYATR
jgi:wyosine [tRNA(Phe)-imidazoG37] synthetase (radical SAM superfamily)